MTAKGPEQHVFPNIILRLFSMSPRRALMEKGIESWEDIKTIVEEVLWFPLLHDVAGRGFWDKVVDRANIYGGTL